MTDTETVLAGMRKRLDIDEQLGRDSDDMPPLLDAVEAVLAMHQPTEDGMGYLDDGSYGDMGTVCGTCGTADEYGVPWPCATVRAVTEALGVES